MLPSLPKQLHAVICQTAIPTQKRQVFRKRLSNDKSVERVAVMKGQRNECAEVRFCYRQQRDAFSHDSVSDEAIKR